MWPAYRPGPQRLLQNGVVMVPESLCVEGGAGTTCQRRGPSHLLPVPRSCTRLWGRVGPELRSSCGKCSRSPSVPACLCLSPSPSLCLRLSFSSLSLSPSTGPTVWFGVRCSAAVWAPGWGSALLLSPLPARCRLLPTCRPPTARPLLCVTAPVSLFSGTGRRHSFKDSPVTHAQREVICICTAVCSLGASARG